MKVRVGKSTKMPTLWSHYISDCRPETAQLICENKPFASYSRKTKEYEVTDEVFLKLKEEIITFEDQREILPVFERKSKEPYGYQQDAVEFAMKTDNIFVNFSQGMGKTLTAMKIVDARNLKRVLVVCGQGNLQEEWIKDGTKHGYKDKLNMQIVGDDTGAGNSKKVSWLKAHAEDERRLDLINIEALRSVCVIDELNAACYDCIIVDEVQSAKGWKAEQTQGMHELIRYNKQVRIALSGTPVLNDPLEFFSMLRYFNMLENTARTTFEKFYGEWAFDFWGHYICKGYKNLEYLNELIQPIICYAGKKELSLPPKKRRRIDVLSTNLEEFNDLAKVYKYSTARLKKAGFETKPQIRARMQYLSGMADGKLNFIEEHARNAKVLVFSQFTTVLENYCLALRNKGFKVLYYHGKLSMNERLEVLKEWREGDYDILLLSIMTARYGLNLTEATETIFIEPPTSLAILEQAEDRAHRIGQQSQVNSYLLVGTDLDASALESIAEKQRALDDLASLRT